MHGLQSGFRQAQRMLPSQIVFWISHLCKCLQISLWINSPDLLYQFSGCQKKIQEFLSRALRRPMKASHLYVWSPSIPPRQSVEPFIVCLWTNSQTFNFRKSGVLIFRFVGPSRFCSSSWQALRRDLSMFIPDWLEFSWNASLSCLDEDYTV